MTIRIAGELRVRNVSNSNKCLVTNELREIEREKERGVRQRGKHSYDDDDDEDDEEDEKDDK